MLFALLLTFVSQLSHLCFGQCYDPTTFCQNSLENYPSSCTPPDYSALPATSTFSTAVCTDNDLISWKEGIEDGTLTASDPLIDYNFIICQKSFSLCGYVPLNDIKTSSSCGQIKEASSGVIIGAGVDLGQETTSTISSYNVDISSLGLDDYLGITGTDAIDKLCSAPKSIGTLYAQQVYDLSIAVMNDKANQIQTWYDSNKADASLPSFAGLPLGIRTVMTTIYWRMGKDEEMTQPFWEAILSNDFNGAATALRNMYGCGITDEYLQKEANVIEASLGCNAAVGLDCVFLIDESGSVGADNFQLAMDWVEDFIESFESSISGSDSGARFGLATFSSGYTNEFYLNENSDISGYRTAIQDVVYSGGSTYLGEALQYIGTYQFQTSNGMRDISTPKALIVMTDGQANGAVAVTDGAAYLSSLDLGINVIAVGIAGYSLTQLQQITTDEYIYELSSFTDLTSIIGGITKKTCYVEVKLDTETLNTLNDVKLAAGKSQTYPIDTSLAYSGENIVLDITQKSGCVYVYVSYCNDHPSYTTNDVKFTSCSQSVKRIIAHPSSPGCPLETTLKVTIEARDISCNRRRLQSSNISSFDLSISTCNSAGVGCVNGTNYDPDLDVDPPYFIDEVVFDPTNAPTDTLIDASTNSPTNNSTDTPTINQSDAATNVPTDDVFDDEELDEANGSSTDMIPVIVVIIVIAAVGCICGLWCSCCHSCGSSKSQAREQRIRTTSGVYNRPPNTDFTV